MFKNILSARWVSNVKICENDDSALATMILSNSNTLFTKTLEFQVNSNTIIHKNGNNTLYCDFLMTTTTDIISNFKKLDDNYTGFDILIDNVIVSNVDFIINAMCYYSQIKCRFYLDNDYNHNTTFKLGMDCVYLNHTNRNDIRSGPVDTMNFHYENGFCIPRNIKMLYFK